jgi:hypothetical protein
VYGTSRSTPWGFSIYEFGVQGEFVRPLSVDRTAGQKFPWNLNVSPNPFNPTADIRFSIKEAGIVTLKIYNVQGQEVASIISEKLAPGTYAQQWNAGNLPSGVYFCRMQAGPVTETKKLVLLR